MYEDGALTITASDYVFAKLAEIGVRHVFVLPGGGCMHLVDALARNQWGVQAVTLLHEQSVGVAAEAYGQVANSLGVALVTTGPGGTNAVTAVAAAWLDSTPCLFLSGQVKSADLALGRGVRQFGFQEVDIVSIVSPITKMAETVVEPESLPDALERAIISATSGRPGPVWLDIPLDVQGAQLPDKVPKEGSKARHSHTPPSSALCLSPEISQIADAIAASKRPLVLAGNGIRLAHAQQQLHELMALTRVPVQTTWKTLDFVEETHPLFAGRPGSVASRFANFALQSADVVLSIGARLDLGQVGYRHDTFARSAHAKFIVDIDQFELSKLEIPRMQAIRASADDFLSQLILELRSRKINDFTEWLQQIATWKRLYPIHDEKEDQWNDGLSLYSLVEELSRQLTETDVLAPGSSGACSEITMQAFKVKRGQRVVNSEGLGSMGFGVPGAIGACLASGRRTVCVDGDGGFAMNMQDLASVSRMNLPIKFVVLDNDGYGSIRVTQDRYFGGRRLGSDPGSGLRLPNYAACEDVFGMPVSHARSYAEFSAELANMLRSEGPGILLAKVSPRQETRFRTQTVLDGQGRPRTAPLEELYPPL